MKFIKLKFVFKMREGQNQDCPWSERWMTLLRKCDLITSFTRSFRPRGSQPYICSVPLKLKWSVLHTPKNKLRVTGCIPMEMEIWNNFYVGILYNTPTRCKLEPKLVIFEKLNSKIALFITNLAIFVTNIGIFQKLASPLPTSCIPQVGNPWFRPIRTLKNHNETNQFT